MYCLPNSHSTAALGSCSSVWQNSTAAFISLHLLSNHYHAIYGERICAILDCCIFQKVAFLKIKYAAHPVSLENRLETLPQTYTYPGQSLCRCKTLAAELIQMFERACRLYQMLERYGRSEIILSTSVAGHPSFQCFDMVNIHGDLLSMTTAPCFKLYCSMIL